MESNYDLDLDKDTIEFMINELRCNIEERNELNKIDEAKIDELKILHAANGIFSFTYDNHISDTIKAYKKYGTLRRGEKYYDSDTLTSNVTSKTSDTRNTARLDISSIFKNR